MISDALTGCVVLIGRHRPAVGQTWCIPQSEPPQRKSSPSREWQLERQWIDRSGHNSLFILMLLHNLNHVLIELMTQSRRQMKKHCFRSTMFSPGPGQPDCWTQDQLYWVQWLYLCRDWANVSIHTHRLPESTSFFNHTSQTFLHTKHKQWHFLWFRKTMDTQIRSSCICWCVITLTRRVADSELYLSK